MCASPGNVVFFNGNYSTSTAGIVVSYTWNFGDGTNATGTIVQHIYNTVGVYQIALSTITVNGTSTISETIRVRPDPPPVSAAGGRAAT
jgi:PKD repeat protein